MEDLEKILGEKSPEELEAEKTAALEAQAKADAENKTDPELEKRKIEVANLERAKIEALKELQRIREEKKSLKTEEDIPKIDKEDPNSKAWLKEIKDNVNPFQQDIERQKNETFNFAFDKWLKAHPAVAADPEAVKRQIATYERVKDNSGLTQEGIYIDLERSYAANNYEQVLEREREAGFEKAKDDLVFSSPAISRGSTTYKQDHDRMPNLTDEERRVIEAQGWSVDEWWKAKKKHDNQ